MNKSRKLRRPIAAAAAVMMLAGCGTSGGDTEKATAAETTRAQGAEVGSPRTTPSSTEAERLLMPDVTGMSEEEAMAELRDRGVDASSITVDERESLEKAGLVIDQVPASGLDVTGTVNLVVAKPLSPLPDFVGSQISELREWAEERDLKLRETEVLDDTLDEGQIVATTPAAGQVPSSEIAVKVATKPVIESFADVEAAHYETYSFDTGESTVNGDHYQNSLIVTVSGSEPDYVEYDMGRDWERVKGTLGYQDDARSSAQARVQIFTDGKEVFNQIVSFGRSFDIDIDVRDVLRLRFQVTNIDSAYNDSIVFGNLRRIGRPGGGDSSEDASTDTPDE